MDNLTHTLVGAALAEAGLKRRTALGAATLMIGANFPDIDVAGLAFPNSIDIRRGATHGFLALAILPFVLAWLMVQYDRRVRLRREPSAEAASFRQLAILAAISIATHPTLDYMNIYGMRWLMPFVNKWFYADGLFIIDVWLLLALATGVVWSRRSGRVRPARVALVCLAAYTTAMLATTQISLSHFESSRTPGRKMMAGPTELLPWTRDIILESDSSYSLGRWSLISGAREGWQNLPKNDAHPAAVAARQAPEAQPFLRWSRFPFYVVTQQAEVTIVRIADARYTGPSGFGWASVEVRLPRLP